jgi:AcrR family transcriptional regulator
MKKITRKRGRPVDARLITQRREEILDVAARLFARHGYAETDTQLLADQLRVGKGTIYRYYPSKAELFHAVVARGMDRLRERIDRDTTTIVDPLERIRQAIHSFLLHFEDDPHLAQLFVQELACFKSKRKPAYFAHHEQHAEPWRELYRGMVAQGRVRPLLELPGNNVVNELLYGTIIANHALGRQGSAKDQARRIIDIVFHGILTDAERRRNSQTAVTNNHYSPRNKRSKS